VGIFESHRKRDLVRFRNKKTFSVLPPTHVRTSTVSISTVSRYTCAVTDTCHLKW
jgi:hypothetical protein